MAYTSKYTGKQIDELLSQGVPIVDSEDKLETLDLPQGSLRSVAYNTTAVTSFRDMYQPTADNFDQSSGTLVNPELLSSVSKLQWTFPEGATITETFGFYLLPRTFSDEHLKMAGVVFQDGGIAVFVLIDDYNVYTIATSDDTGAWTSDNEAINAFNTLLAEDDWCYFSYPEAGYVITDAQFDTIDMFVKGVSGVQGTDLYIKVNNGWEKQRVKKISQLDNDLNFLQAKNVFANYTEYTGDGSIILNPIPYTLYNFKETDVEITFNKPQVPKPLTKFGLYGKFNFTSNNAISWTTKHPSDIHGFKLIIITYTGDSNVYIGECYSLYNPTFIQYNSDSNSIQLFNGNTNIVGRIEYNNYAIPITNNYEVETIGRHPFYIYLNKVKESMFEGTDIETVYLRTDVEENAFKNCQKLHTIGFGFYGEDKSISVSDAFEGTNPTRVYLYRYGSLCKVSFASEKNPFYYGIEYLYLNNVGNITSLKIEDEFDSIGSYSYANCQLITSVSIPTSVKEINDGAFMNCTAINSVYCKSTLSCGNKNIFKGCTSLANIEVVNADWLVGNFDSDNNVESIVVDNISTASSVDFATLFPNLKSLTIDSVNGDVIITSLPATLEQISVGKNAKNVEITLPSANVEISFNKECEPTYVGFNSYNPKKVSTSDLSLWAKCSFNHKVSSSPTNISYNGKYIPIFPLGVHSIGQNFAYMNPNITEIEIPETVYSIGANAFGGCANLRTLVLNTVFTSALAEASSFSGKYIESIEGNFASDDGRYAHKKGKLYLFAGYGLEEYTIPNDITYLHNGIDSDSLLKLHINHSLTIGEHAYSLLQALTGVYVPSLDVWYNMVDLHTNGLASGSFFHYSENASLYVDNEKLTSLKVDNVKMLKKGLFSYMAGLEDAEFLEVTYIPEMYFEGCKDLSKVVIGTSILSIYGRAFYGCNNLTKLDCTQCESIPTLNLLFGVSNSFPSNCQIVVPDALYDEWIVAKNWADLASQIVKASEYVEPTNE